MQQSPRNVLPSSNPPRRRRVPITIVDFSAPTSTDRPAAAATELPHAQSTSSTRAHSSEPSPEFQHARAARDAHQSRVGGGIFRANGHHTVFAANPKSTSASTSPGTPTAQSTVSHKPATVVEVVQSDVQQLHTPDQDAPEPCITLFQFNQRWEARQDIGERWNLLAVCATVSIYPAELITSS